MCGGVCVCVCVHMCMYICMDLYSIPMSFYCIDSALEHINLCIMRFTNVVYNNNNKNKLKY